MILYLMILLFSICFFFLGFYLGKSKKNEDVIDKKIYTIEFEKLHEDGKIIKSSFVVQNVMLYCDSLGIEILNLEMDDIADCILKVNCTKDQYFLLIQELSNPKYQIELSSLSFK